MPNLPAVSVPTQAQYDAIVNIFPGATTAEKAANYQIWSLNNLIQLVGSVKAEQALRQIQASLPALTPEVPFY